MPSTQGRLPVTGDMYLSLSLSLSLYIYIYIYTVSHELGGQTALSSHLPCLLSLFLSPPPFSSLTTVVCVLPTVSITYIYIYLCLCWTQEMKAEKRGKKGEGVSDE